MLSLPFLLASLAQAQTVKGNWCQGYCLKVSKWDGYVLQIKRIEGLGKTEREAWNRMSFQCRNNRFENSFLVKPKIINFSQSWVGRHHTEFEYLPLTPKKDCSSGEFNQEDLEEYYSGSHIIFG